MSEAGNQASNMARVRQTVCGAALRRGLCALAVTIGALAVMLDSTCSFAAVDTIKKIVVLGDSLTAGLGLAPKDAFPAQLEARLRKKGYVVEVANAGVSGDTTAAALERLKWAVPLGTDAVIVELGANDALRAVPTQETRANLAAILDELSRRQVRVLLAGFKAPRNLGTDYQEPFETIYPELAEIYHAQLYPFFLDGVALDPKLNQTDGMHPNRDGVAEIVTRILPAVEELITSAH